MAAAAQRNFAPRTIWTGDNLDILRGLNSETVDLIYLDPPFNSKADYAAPIGSQAAGAAFKDTWTLDDLDTAWLGLIAERHPAMYRVIEAAGVSHSNGMKAYLCMMGVRLLEMRRVLKPTGSIYLHCDDAAVHYLKMLMDAVFGRGRHQNEIVWQRTSNHNNAGRFGRTTDRLLFYGADINKNSVCVPLNETYVKTKYRYHDKRGRYRTDNLTGPGVRLGASGDAWRGWNPTDSGIHWKVPRTGAYAAWIEANLIPGYRDEISIIVRLELLDQAGLVSFTANGRPELKRYLHASPGQVPPDLWIDVPPVNSQARERTGYPTQKPLTLLNRIIQASSNPGDVVLDPFCGCATACVAADNLQREWIGIDISPKAVELVHMRLRDTLGGLYHAGMVTARTDIPQRTDIEAPIPYRLNKHVLFGRQEGLCAGCRSEFPYRAFEVDHVIPQSRGGTDHIDNLQLLCSFCNRTKGNRTMEYLMARLAEFRQSA